MQPALITAEHRAVGMPHRQPPRLRGRSGRFLRKLQETPETELCWLIWSRYWRAWHRRDAAGRAAGYTTDIAHAGLFPYSKARAYHDGDRNEAWHVSDKVDLIDHEISVIHLLLGNLHEKAHVARGRAA